MLLHERNTTWSSSAGGHRLRFARRRCCRRNILPSPAWKYRQNLSIQNSSTADGTWLPIDRYRCFVSESSSDGGKSWGAGRRKENIFAVIRQTLHWQRLTHSIEFWIDWWIFIDCGRYCRLGRRTASSLRHIPRFRRTTNLNVNSIPLHHCHDFVGGAGIIDSVIEQIAASVTQYHLDDLRHI